MIDIPDAPWISACERTGYYRTTVYEDECESCEEYYPDAEDEEEEDGEL